MRRTPGAPPSAFENPHFLREFRRDRPLRRANGEFDFGAGRIMTLGAWLEEAKLLGLDIPEVEPEDEDWRTKGVYIHGRFTQETFENTIEILLAPRDSEEADSVEQDRFRSRLLRSVRASLTEVEQSLVNRRFTGRQLRELQPLFPDHLPSRIQDHERYRIRLAARVTIVHGDGMDLSRSLVFRDER